tara:strand:+ start:388 stop:1113 length:726 start_codon:yes stop_codon:yes gene_type:complete
MKNLKLIGLFLVSSLFVGTTIADDHAEAGPFYAFYHLQTANPAAVVAAMDKFWASDCGKKYPADVALSEEVFNGGNASTHFIINTFQNAEDQASAAEIMRSCPSALTFLSEFYNDAQATSQYMGPAAIDENDWTQDSVFAKYDIIVEPQNQAAYAAAYADMMQKVSKDAEVRSYGLGSIHYGRDKFTHWVWVGARSIPELSSINEKVQAHSAFAEFNAKVGGMRTIVNTTQVQILKGYERQ